MIESIHVRYDWVTSHMSESCHIWVNHVTYEWRKIESILLTKASPYLVNVTHLRPYTKGFVKEACLRFSSEKIVEFVSFTGALTSQYVVKPVKATCETVRSIPKETCQKVTRFDEPYETACFWGVNETSKDGHVYELWLCKFVE